jgi:glucuronyl esterase-like protein
MRTKRLFAALSCAPFLLTTLVAPSVAQVGPIASFPEPESFTEKLHTIPNPFISWEGTKVTPGDWPARAAQLKQIMQHYETGYLPSTQGITVSLAITRAQSGFTAANQAGAAQVTVYKDGVPAPTKIDISFFLPNPATTKIPCTRKGCPVVFNTSTSVGGFFNLAAEYGIATVGIDVRDIDSGDNETGSYKGANRAGVVQDIFNIMAQMPDASRTLYSAGLVNGRWLPPYLNTPGDPNAPSLMVSQSWGISRVVDAIESAVVNNDGTGQKLINVDVTKSALTGISRLGKLTLVAGAYDTRFAVVNSVSSGSGGTVIDRFHSNAVSERQSLALDPSYGYAYELNKKYHYVKILEKSTWDNTFRADAVLPAEALIDPAGRRDGGTTAASAFQGNEDYRDFASGLKVADGTLNPIGTGANGTSTTGVGHGDNIKPGYGVINFGIQTGAGAEFGQNQGTQNFTDVRWGYGSWFSPRFRQWPILPEYADVDIVKRINRGEYGYIITNPFDQHYLMALIAPRALLLQDGYLSNNTSPEGTYMGYLAAREVYRFLGAERRLGINIHLINHANPLREQMELGEFMVATFNQKAPDPKFNVQPFPINDPRSLYDYKKLDWAAPGYKSLKKQVEQLCNKQGVCPTTSVRAASGKSNDAADY